MHVNPPNDHNPFLSMMRPDFDICQRNDLLGPLLRP